MKRTSAVAFAAAVVAVVGLGATSWACTSLATLNLSEASGAVGESITVTGSSFKATTPEAAAPPVALHWNAMDGPVVAQTNTDAAGNISTIFAIPESQPGNFVVIARQLDAEGKDHWGTPARAGFQVLGAGTAPIAEPSVASRPFSTASSDSNSAVTLALGLGGLGLVLFGAGFMAVVRQTRRQPVPVSAKAPQAED